MRVKRFICRQCGHKFQTEVLEPGEAEERRIRPASVRCPKCRSINVEKD